ncbi:hypothetical protein ALNOE001_13040 [Candidatus Methanobinarius endosymbioticus]|uniref:Big-1 domain-containing protein n=1 Tax=Candidatus Methanobinarius endosymbioticus TaxID=2006182 RepID=A0A366MAG3_9EURY|nr:hypothetical protein ALNOE001_13040 [Candidatus Methanobinarius endosymbioticus]
MELDFLNTNNSVNLDDLILTCKTVTIKSKLIDDNGNPIAGATINFYANGKKLVLL